MHFTDDAGYTERRTSDVTAAVLGQLTLAEWTGAGLTTHTKILIRVEVDGDHLYRHADAGAAIGALLDGNDALGASRVTRVRRLVSDALRLHDNPDTDSMSAVLNALAIAARLRADRDGAGLGPLPSEPAATSRRFSPIDPAAALVIDALADNDRVIVAVASPS